MKKIVKGAFLGVLGLGFAIFFAPVATVPMLNLGNFMGMLLFGVPILAILFWKKISPRAKALWQKPLSKILCALLAAALLGGSLFAGITGRRIIRAAGNTPPEDETLTVVVLGCRVYDSGPSLMLQSRIETAFDYLTAHPEAVCILSGGQGRDEPMTEAQCMYDALTDLGIDKTRLLLEEESTSTQENMEFATAIIEEQNLPRQIAVITNEYHQYRAALIAEKLGYTECCAVSAPSQKILLPTYFLREIFGVAYLTLTSR